MLKKLFTDLYKKQGFKRDYLYDWIKFDGDQKKLCADFLRLQTNSYYNTSIEDSEEPQIAIKMEKLGTEKSLDQEGVIKRNSHQEKKLSSRKQSMFFNLISKIKEDSKQSYFLLSR